MALLHLRRLLVHELAKAFDTRIKRPGLFLMYGKDFSVCLVLLQSK